MWRQGKNFAVLAVEHNFLHHQRKNFLLIRREPARLVAERDL